MKYLAIIVAVLVYGAVALATDAHGGTSSTAPTACSTAERQIVALFNARRAQQTAIDGIARQPLVMTQALCQAAEVRCSESRVKFYPLHERTVDIATQDSAHKILAMTPDGKYDYFNTVLPQFGVTYAKTAEFTYFSTYSQRTAAYIVNLWLSTEFRLTETLRPAYKQAAAGLCTKSTGGTVAAALLVKP